jgi:hypothetical protein
MTETVMIIAAVVGTYAALAAGFIWLGRKLQARAGSSGGPFGWTVHVVAAFAFVIGLLVAWMGWSTDHPMKERHLLMPLIFVALVYGYILIIWVKAGALAIGIAFLRGLRGLGEKDHQKRV